MEARTVDFATTIRTRPFVASRPHDIDDNPQEWAMKVSEHASNLPPTPMCQPHPPPLLPCSPPPPPPPSTLKSSQVGLALMHYFLPSSRITVLPSTRPPRVIRLASTLSAPKRRRLPPFSRAPPLPNPATPPRSSSPAHALSTPASCFYTGLRREPSKGHEHHTTRGLLPASVKPDSPALSSSY